MYCTVPYVLATLIRKLYRAVDHRVLRSLIVPIVRCILSVVGTFFEWCKQMSLLSWQAIGPSLFTRRGLQIVLAHTFIA